MTIDTIETKKDYACPNCGSTDTRREAAVCWNVEEQKYNLWSIGYFSKCENCGHKFGDADAVTIHL